MLLFSATAAAFDAILAYARHCCIYDIVHHSYSWWCLQEGDRNGLFSTLNYKLFGRDRTKPELFQIPFLMRAYAAEMIV